MEVRQLVSFLCIKIDENREELKTQHISNALFGLRGLRSEHAETKQLLKVGLHFISIIGKLLIHVYFRYCAGKLMRVSLHLTRKQLVTAYLECEI